DMMERVLTVLLTNAADAMRGRENKSLRVITRSVQAKDHQRWIQVVVSDVGCGIKGEDLTRIFNPFFTTKDPDKKGKGLGLSIAYRIIQDHGGRIWAENNEWGGATFFIELPTKEPNPG
ncbi:MAG: ATP-binding protein, partial [Deltaproteobacteria bacterium]|nr:ATP-binding protein [Deltaproteobacteria bacterium]